MLRLIVRLVLVASSYLRRFDSAVLEGQGAFRACQQLLEEQWIPDVLLAMRDLVMAFTSQMLSQVLIGLFLQMVLQRCRCRCGFPSAWAG